ncbi:CsbD family protein [Kitasatospora arboriphila]|uniref:CsbD-like domain-containing protein n=1 Tax=Kitasatospora arboriphila TaxID=258052 RepID=A0ABP4E3B4_9ACTN
MGMGKKAAHKAEEVKGGAKKAAGAATGNRSLEAEGRAEQMKGAAKQAGAKAKDGGIPRTAPPPRCPHLAPLSRRPRETGWEFSWMRIRAISRTSEASLFLSPEMSISEM